MTEENPTERQKESGNYRKGKFRHRGLEFAIENAKGSVRSGKDKNGKEWSVVMNNHYGYCKGTIGADSDGVDVFFGPDMESEKVYVIDQQIDGQFDEHKVCVGFNSEQEAASAYKSNYSPDWNGLASITEMDWDEFKDWLGNGDKTQPVGLRMSIAKKYEHEGVVFVYGPVLVPGKFDRQGDIVDEDEIRKAARRYMDYQRAGERHEDMISRDEVWPTQSFIAPADFQIEGKTIQKGTWVVEMAVKSPRILKLIESGRYRGFSIGGNGARRKIS